MTIGYLFLGIVQGRRISPVPFVGFENSYNFDKIQESLLTCAYHTEAIPTLKKISISCALLMYDQDVVC